jgi:hypothetical protein
MDPKRIHIPAKLGIIPAGNYWAQDSDNFAGIEIKSDKGVMIGVFEYDYWDYLVAQGIITDTAIEVELDLSSYSILAGPVGLRIKHMPSSQTVGFQRWPS